MLTTRQLQQSSAMSAVRDLAVRAAEAGTFDPAVDPVDLLRALSGVLNIAAGTDAGKRARRLVDVLFVGAAPATGRKA